MILDRMAYTYFEMKNYSQALIFYTKELNIR